MPAEIGIFFFQFFESEESLYRIQLFFIEQAVFFQGLDHIAHHVVECPKLSVR